MGKAARWFRGLLGLKKEETGSQSAAAPKRRWSFIRSHREKYRTIANNTAEDRSGYSQGNVPPPKPGYADGDVVSSADPSRHAIAVAAATAAVAEAAVAAAQAAAEVVRLTSSARPNNASTATAVAHVSSAGYGIREEQAAVKIQAHFRGYLGRKALRALKGLVKLQALVRGHIVRKETADIIRRMQALLRAQARARARAVRTQISESPRRSSTKSSQFNYHIDAKGPATPEKFEPAIRSKSTKCDRSPILRRNGSNSIGQVIINPDKSHNGWKCLDQRGYSVKTGQRDEEKSDVNQMILEVDTGRPHFIQKRKSLFQSFHHALALDPSFSSSKDSTTHQTSPSPSSCEVQSSSPSKFTQAVKETPFCTADNSPQFYSASSRGGNSDTGPFGSAKSDGARSHLSCYAGHPNYMACTESSKAKMRSLSAPKQRPQFERSVSDKRFSVHLYGDSRSSNQRVGAHFANKAHRSFGRLDTL